MPAKGQPYNQTFQTIAVRYAILTLFCTAIFLKSLFSQMVSAYREVERISVLEMVRECTLSTVISTLFTKEVGCKLSHGE